MALPIICATAVSVNPWTLQTPRSTLSHARLSEAQRHDRHFAIIALAYVLCAFGAAAETLDSARQLKANTRSERVMNLARIGNYFLQIYQ